MLGRAAGGEGCCTVAVAASCSDSAENAAVARGQRSHDEIIEAMTRTAAAAATQQQELTRQTQILLKTVDATERVIKLEDALNQNLDSLRGAQHFDQTVNSLAAAISLLNSRLGQVPDEGTQVRLPRPNKTGNAA